MGPRPHLWFWAHITACSAQEYQDHRGSSLHHVVLCMQNSAFWTRITSLNGSQTSPVDFLLAKQGDPTIRKTSLYESQPSCVVLWIQSSDFMDQNNIVSKNPRPQLFILCVQNAVLTARINSIYWSQTSSVVFACKTETFGPELQVSMWFQPSSVVLCMQNRVILDQNFKSPSVPALIYGFVHARSACLWPRITYLYGSQTSPVPCVQCKPACLPPELIKYILVPALICGFVLAKQRLYGPE